MTWRVALLMTIVASLVVGGAVFVAVCYQPSMTAVRDSYGQKSARGGNAC